ncbi:MAG: hypothetical protein FWD61_13685 [Phycisphaerales bacterium]|nr:hypothetical protein [Phycisphaerales bacterium]
MKSSIRQCLSLALLAALTCSCTTQSASKPIDIQPDNTLPAGVYSDPTQIKMVWMMTNFFDDAMTDKFIAIARRAGKAGYTHVLVSDVKFMKWDFMGDKLADNVHRFVDACHKAHLKVWAGCAPMGYANALLMRDPNLAEGLPVEGDFIVDQSLLLKPYDPDLKLANGDFSGTRTLEPTTRPQLSVPTGWSADLFNQSIFLDSVITWGGKPSLRIEPAPVKEISAEALAAGERPPANGVWQSIDVKPFHYYHLHAMIKTQGKSLKRGTQIAVVADDPKHPGEKTVLNYQTPLLPATTDWQEFNMTFNSLEYSRVKLTLPGRRSGGGGGAGGQGSETVWWADVTIEPGQFVNIIRRDGAPLKIINRTVGAQTFFTKGIFGKVPPVVEGKDITPVVDSFLGRSPGAGTYTIWHTPPAINLIPGSRLRAGDILRASYYVPAIIHDGQVMCCMAEPKTYDIIKWQIQQIHRIMNPDGYFMGHDELRSQGYDKSCVDSGKSMQELLADNVCRITKMIKAEDPGKDICTWSDLFDPFHNAKNDGKRYYLVKGVSPWYGAWTGLDRDVIIMNWHGPFDGNQNAAVKFFSDLGHRQILSGYYDKPIDPFRGRLDNASHYPGVIGSMYTTWTANFDLMEDFAKLCDEWKSQHATPKLGDYPYPDYTP